jgi:Ca2+-binding EF-hand superfamily protein
MAHEMIGRDFRKLTDHSPDMKASLQDLCLRREFKEAVVLQLNKEFPYHNPREAFDAVCAGKCSDEGLDREAVGNLMRKMNPEFTDEQVLEMMKVLDMSNLGKVTFDEFKKVFVADIRTSASI